MLRHLLTERGISQASAAREMGMAPSTVSDILRGKRGIGRKHIEAFATYFHVSPAVFLPEPWSGAALGTRNHRSSVSGRVFRIEQTHVGCVRGGEPRLAVGDLTALSVSA